MSKLRKPFTLLDAIQRFTYIHSATKDYFPIDVTDRLILNLCTQFRFAGGTEFVVAGGDWLVSEDVAGVVSLSSFLAMRLTQSPQQPFYWKVLQPPCEEFFDAATCYREQSQKSQQLADIELTFASFYCGEVGPINSCFDSYSLGAKN